LLTAIIPVTRIYRFENIFEKMLKSVLERSIFLIIVHDIQDSKTSNTLNLLLNELPSKQFLLLEGAYGSPGAARNAGLKHVKTDWVVFWDADDLPNPDSFLQMQNFGTEHNFDLVVGNILVTDYLFHTQKRHSVKPYSNYFDLFATLPAFTRVLYRFEFIRRLEYPTIKFGEDLCFLMTALSCSPSIGLLDVDAYKYILYPAGQQTQAKGIVENTSLALQITSDLPRINKSFKMMLLVVELRMVMSALKRSWGETAFYSSDLPKFLVRRALRDPICFLKALSTLFLKKESLL